jgi:hypothetical protein
VDLTDDVDGDVGALDVDAMEQIRDEFTRLDGLVEEAGFDSLIDPQVVRVTLGDGIGTASWCRFDVRWYRAGFYNVHHVDEAEVNFRYDHHPKTDAPDRHFHPPPDASSDDPEQSYIRVEAPALVTRAVHKLWRRAYETGTLDGLNTAPNPP